MSSNYVVKNIPERYLVKLIACSMYLIRYHYPMNYTAIFLPFVIMEKVDVEYMFVNKYEMTYIYHDNGEVTYGLDAVEVNNFPEDIKYELAYQLLEQAIDGFYHSIKIVRENQLDYTYSKNEWLRLTEFCKDI